MSVLKMNLRLIFTALKKKYHLIWVEKGEWIYPLALYTLKKTGAKLVHYNTDDLYGLTNHFWLHRIGIKYYDLYLTTNRNNVYEITNNYKICTMRVGMGFEDNYYQNKICSEKKFDIVHINTIILLLELISLDFCSYKFFL
jgi:hypothetical protein